MRSRVDAATPRRATPDATRAGSRRPPMVRAVHGPWHGPRRGAQVTAIGPPFDPVAPFIGAGEKM
jgi:hypothetical protein